MSPLLERHACYHCERMAAQKSTSKIDGTILSVVGGRWEKVAMVIATVANAMESDLPDGDDGCRLVARHIETLIRDGRLLAQGDVTNWRFSEVRRPT